MQANPVDTLAFDDFWGWLAKHPNCILRAGTPDAVLIDDEDLHWHFAADGPTVYVQVIRGKRLMGELVCDPERVTYVQVYDEGPEGEFSFELIAEGEAQREVPYFFVMSHGFEEQAPSMHGPAIH